jgi:hypothetical protein
MESRWSCAQKTDQKLGFRAGGIRSFLSHACPVWLRVIPFSGEEDEISRLVPRGRPSVQQYLLRLRYHRP